MPNTARAIITKGMKIITRIEALRIGSFSLTALGLFGLAFVLLVSAVPSLTARFVMLTGNATREALLTQTPVSRSALDEMIQTRRTALIFRPMADAMDDLALAALTQAGAENPDSKAIQNAWKDAFYWQRRALGRAPSDTFGWARLGYMLMQTEGATDAAATALMRSLDTGPYEPSLMLIRLNMALALSDKLDADVKASLPFMVRGAWEHDFEGLVKTAQEKHFVGLVEKALENDLDKLEAFREKIPQPAAPQNEGRDSAPQKKR
jgi:hypothetical protein